MPSVPDRLTSVEATLASLTATTTNLNQRMATTEQHILKIVECVEMMGKYLELLAKI